MEIASMALCAQCAVGTSVNVAACAAGWNAISRVAESSRVGMRFFMVVPPFSMIILCFAGVLRGLLFG